MWEQQEYQRVREKAKVIFSVAVKIAGLSFKVFRLR